jgi:hypothetical protein
MLEGAEAGGNRGGFIAAVPEPGEVAFDMVPAYLAGVCGEAAGPEPILEARESLEIGLNRAVGPIAAPQAPPPAEGQILDVHRMRVWQDPKLSWTSPLMLGIIAGRSPNSGQPNCRSVLGELAHLLLQPVDVGQVPMLEGRGVRHGGDMRAPDAHDGPVQLE